MKPSIDESTLENELVQYLAEEAARAVLETPLREPILAAVEETSSGSGSGGEGEQASTDDRDGGRAALAEEAAAESGDEDEESTAGATEETSPEQETGTGTARRALKSLILFGLMLAVLYGVRERLAGDEE